MSGKEVKVKATIEIELNTWFDLDDLGIDDDDDLESIETAVYGEIEQEARAAVMAMEAYNTQYTITEVSIDE